MAPKSARNMRMMRECRLESLPDILTIEQVARYLGVGRNTAYDAVARGQIPAFRVGRRLLVSKVALQRLAHGVSTSHGVSTGPRRLSA